MTEQASNTWVWDVDSSRPKNTWGPGPWQDEPDKVVWIDPSTDLDCMIVRGPSGALCGYVAVTGEHPWYGKDYNSLYGDDDRYVEVHGGLTFANECHGTICHVPAEGRSDDVWWFGFDCAHGGDICPAFESIYPHFDRATYKDIGYVKRECEMLAHQLKEAE
jgi:hypothetical protein